MKRQLLIYTLLIVFVLHGNVSAKKIKPTKPGYQQIECTLIPVAPKNERNSHPHIPGPKSKDTRAGQATSTNWCGYVAESNLTHPAKNSVTAVYGSWIVPVVESSSTATYAAFWIGIDGYSSSTVEQIGTSHDFVNGALQQYAWFEMYPGGSYVINGFSMNAGDVISASVLYSGNNIFTMTLHNDTKQISYTVPTSYTKSTTAQRSCAEWIVEAPYLNSILPLADFVTAYLWGCMATINGVTASINNSSWPNASIEMVTNSGAAKAIPSALLQDNGSFFVTWKHQ